MFSIAVDMPFLSSRLYVICGGDLTSFLSQSVDSSQDTQAVSGRSMADSMVEE